MSLNYINFKQAFGFDPNVSHYLTQEEKELYWKKMLELDSTKPQIDSPNIKTFLGIYEDFTVPERNENGDVTRLYFALQDYRPTNEILIKHIEKRFVYGEDSLYIRERYSPHCRDLILYEIDLTLCPINNIHEIKKYLKQLYQYPKNTRLFPGIIVIDKNQILGQYENSKK